MNDRRDGMGAIPFEGGTAFRVWAPHAEAVHVRGDFNEWYGDATPLESEGNGYWYAESPDARAGHEYLYAITHAGNTFDRIDPYARQVTSSVGNAVVYDDAAFDWEGDAFVIPPHNELVIYELHVGSFVAESPDQPGRFDLVQERLDHLVALGVNAIQIMPVAEFAGDRSWGYNPAHIFAVETAYGGPDAFKRLVKTAHYMGLAVILDVVYNHFGPSDLDLWCFDGWSENGKGGIYFYNDHRSATPWGDTRPDYGREEVRRFIRDNALMWLRQHHVDGLRYDMTPYIRSVGGIGLDLPDGWDLMRWVNTSVRDEFPGRITIAEDMQRDPRVSQVGDDGAAFHAQWDGAFVHPVREAVTAMDDLHRSLDEVIEAVTTRYNDDAFQRVIYTESHDEVANGRARVPEEVNPVDSQGWHAQKQSTLGAALMFASPGIPMMFQGQEFLQDGYFRDDVPLEWHRAESFGGIVQMYRDLVHLRRNAGGDTRGLTGQHVAVLHANHDDNMLVLHRWADGGPGDDVLIVANLSHREHRGYRIGVPAEGHWPLAFNSDADVYNPDFSGIPAADLHADADGHDGQPAGATLDIGPYAALFFRRA